MQVDFPIPNPAIAAVLVSSEMRAILEERTNMAKALYQEQVAKRSGRLAASANVEVDIGGVHHDRVVGHLTVGQGLDYGASHEFGTDPRFHRDAAHDLNRVLEQLAGA